MKNVTYINAGAGSGKTYTLTTRLAQMLGSDANSGITPIKPSQVILTTFTTLAAAEIREKARTEILKKGNLTVASQMDSACIGTVHSLALRMIKRFWYLLDYGADIKTISERDENYYMSQSLERIVNTKDEDGHKIWRQDLDNFGQFRDHFNISDSYGHPDYNFWKSILKDVVEKMEYYDVNEITVSIEKSSASVREVFKNAPVTQTLKKELLDYLEKYYDFIRTIDTGASIDQQRIIKPILQNCDHVSEMYPLLSSLSMKGKPVTGATKIENNCPGYNDFITKLESTMLSSSELDFFEPFIKSIFTLAKVWRDDLMAYKKRNHIISYNDMERLFLHLITQEQEVKDYIADSFRLIMVDEFQDSNPIQLKIFNTLSELIGAKGGHSYWVGDPKQSIYGFRGSDTDLVNQVAKHFKFYEDDKIHPEEGKSHLGSGRLVESWRSREPLVELVNDTFFEPFINDNIDKLLIKLKPHFTTDELKDPAIVHWQCTETNKDNAAIALAYKIKQLLSSGMMVHHGKQQEGLSSIQPSDIAVLYKTNANAKNLIKALRQLNVPVSEPEDNITQRVEAQLVMTLLQFIHNQDNKHVRADLQRLLLGKSTQEILKDRIQYVHERTDKKWEMTGDDKWLDDIPEIETLKEQTERFKHLSIPEMVRGLILECDILNLVAKWDDAITRCQNLSTLQHLAEDYDEMCVQLGRGSSINGFINYLNTNDPDKEKDNQSNTVKVLTYHGSKGLEWSVVILCDLHDDKLESNKFIKNTIMSVREMVLNDNSNDDNPFNKDYYLHLFPYHLSSRSANANVNDAERSRIEQLDICKNLQEKARSEERRLLYVGATRAKDFLYTFQYGKNGFNWLQNAGVNNPTKDNVWGNDAHQPEYAEITKPEQFSQDMNKTCELIVKPQEHNQYEKRYLSPSKISDYTGFGSHNRWQVRGQEMNTEGWGEDYAAIGSCIHDIYAAYRPGENETNYETAKNTIGGYGLTSELSGRIEEILKSADWLYSLLSERFPQHDGDKVIKEYPFMMTTETGQTLRGEMDLLWLYTDTDGQHCVIVDYKTFPGVELDEHTTGHYAQLSAYVDALRKSGIDVAHALIYYPIHGVIHELTSSNKPLR